MWRARRCGFARLHLGTAFTRVNGARLRKVDVARAHAGTMRVHIACTGNTCRSPGAESMMNEWGAGRVEAWSTPSRGGAPTGQIDSRMVRQLQRLGIGAPTRNGTALPAEFDALIAIDSPGRSSNAENLERRFPGQKVIRWVIEDPFIEGTEEAYRRAADQLAEHVRAFVEKA